MKIDLLYPWLPAKSTQVGITGKQYVLTTPVPTPSSGFIVSFALTITGTYKMQFQLSLAITPEVPGGVSNITGGANGSFYDSGTVLSLTAATPVADGADTQWVFKDWSGGATGTTNPVSVAMDAPKSVTANYQAQYKLTLAVTAGLPNGLSNTTGGTNGTFYNSGTVLSLSAATPTPSGRSRIGAEVRRVRQTPSPSPWTPPRTSLPTTWSNSS